jgi:hypothetical protein
MKELRTLAAQVTRITGIIDQVNLMTKDLAVKAASELVEVAQGRTRNSQKSLAQGLFFSCHLDKHIHLLAHVGV